MPTKNDIAWFKANFFGEMTSAVQGTPLTVDFLTALACQESGEVWPRVRLQIADANRVMKLCVGDTIDGRSAFPTSLKQLRDAPNGEAMFSIGRQALVDMAQFVPSYQAMAAKPNKYCHGYGVYQVDIQHFLQEPQYFLDRVWETLDGSLGRAMGVLRSALKKRGLQNATGLSDFDLATVGIVYNTGGFKESLGLKQGFQSSDGKHYGQALFDFIRLAHTVPDPEAAHPILATPPAGEALIATPSPVTTEGDPMKVAVTEGMLRVRSEPTISDPPQANVVAHLPDGQPVRALSGPKKGFFELETSHKGALIRGFASRKFLIDDRASQKIEVVTPATEMPTTGIVAVGMPEKPGLITRRRDPATARSLNEKSMPGRTGTTPDELRMDLAAIVAYLAVDNPEFLRYQPGKGATFCNIYAHDFCMLAGIFLPRCWWTGSALVQISTGKTVEPHLGDTIREMRANDLFGWLRDFGPRFGWRQTGTLTKLQNEVNQGAVGIIVARRKEDGRSGHIVIVVPETAEDTARRNSSGEVTAPLQSQAGTTNFRRGRGRPNWWIGEEFAESAFWLHA